jgi:hypothetical protein
MKVAEISTLDLVVLNESARNCLLGPEMKSDRNCLPEPEKDIWLEKNRHGPSR